MDIYYRANMFWCRDTESKAKYAGDLVSIPIPSRPFDDDVMTCTLFVLH